MDQIGALLCQTKLYQAPGWDPQIPMGYSLNSLKGEYVGDDIRAYSRDYQGGYLDFNLTWDPLVFLGRAA